MSSVDRRREKREAHDASVSLIPEETGRPELSGRLLNCSTGGFCVAHHDRQLVNGTRVRFSWTGRSGMARVIWTRITPRRTESGFLIE
jgi:hypothetical protein